MKLRLIDANALKDAFNAWKNMDDYFHDSNCVDIPFTEAFDIIDNAPTIEERPDGKWIPVSERLPKEDGEYLLWGKIDEDEEVEYTFIGNYDEGSEQFGIWHERFDSRTLGSLGCEFYEYSKVIAWQPLPKPYKGGGANMGGDI